MENKIIKKSYSKEFKEEAIKMCEAQKLSEVSRSLGIHVSMLNKWRKAKKEEGEEAFRGKGIRTAVEEENRQLKQEVRRLKEEAAILKKAAAYFTRDLL